MYYYPSFLEIKIPERFEGQEWYPRDPIFIKYKQVNSGRPGRGY